MPNILLWPNPEKEQVRSLAQQIARWLDKRGIKALMPRDLAHQLNLYTMACATDQATMEEISWVMVLGGDGTLLLAAKQLILWQKPILGVNLGHLGFLTEVEVPDLFPSLPLFLSGEYQLDPRHLLTAEVWRQGRVLVRYEAMNEVVVAKGPFARLVNLETFVDEAYVTTYPADGLIVATPTGSTAYSLSAGGPILTPDLGVFVVTPICPHSFFDRSVVIDANQTVKIRIRAMHRETLLTVDGQEGFPLEDGDEVVVGSSKHTVHLMRRPGWNFFHGLRAWRKGY